MQDVFISYSSIDQVAADAVCHHLEENGIRCWIAHRDIKPGQEWTVAIMNAIRNTRVFVLIYSHNSNASKQVLNEVSNAFSSGSVLIPFRLDMSDMSDGLAYYLHSVHWLDATSQSMQKSIASLHRTVRAVLDAAEEPPAFPKQPRKKPEQKKKKRVWHWIALAIAMHAAIYALLITAIILRTPGYSSGAHYYHASGTGKWFYTSYGFQMLSADREAILLQHQDTGELAAVDIVDMDTILWSAEYEMEEPQMVTVIQPEDIPYAYFVDMLQNEISIYDAQQECWLAENLKIPGLEEYEALTNYVFYRDHILMDRAEMNSITLIYRTFDPTDGRITNFSKMVTVTPEGSFHVADCSELDLRHLLCHFEDVSLSGVLLMMDDQNHPVLVDSGSGQVITRDLKTIYNRYMPNAAENPTCISPDGRYAISYHTVDRDTTNAKIWDLETGNEIWDTDLDLSSAVFFRNDQSAIYYDSDENAVFTVGLEMGSHPKVLLDQKYFNRNFASDPRYFYYAQEYDLLFFVSQGEDWLTQEPYFQVTVTDRTGKVLDKSNKMTVDHTDADVCMEISEDAVLLAIVSRTDAPVNDPVHSAIYRALYTVDAEGNLQFKDSYQ